jgi:hypothetical protein
MAMDSAGEKRTGRWWPVAAVVLGSLFIYHINGKPHPEMDTVAAPYTAWAIARHGSLDLRGYEDMRRYVPSFVRELPNGAWISMRPPGSAFAAVPVMLPFALAREQPLPMMAMDTLGKLAAALSVAGAAGFFFVVCRRLAPDAAWPATTLFALGTCLCSVASQALWMHGPATFWLCAALYCLTRPDADRFIVAGLAGLALGLAVMARPTTALFAAATGTAWLLQRRWRGVFGLAMGGALPLTWLCLLNWTYFGEPFLGGYATDNWAKSPPLWISLSGLLIAPSRGVFVYSPALLLLPVGLVFVARRRQESVNPARSLLLAWLVAAGATLLFYARWYDWRGGWCFGPRFLCEAMPILCLLFAVAYQGLRMGWQRRAAAGLVVASVAIHLVGLGGYSAHPGWQERHELPDDGLCLFSLHDTQIEAHARAVAGKITRALGGGS